MPSCPSLSCVALVPSLSVRGRARGWAWGSRGGGEAGSTSGKRTPEGLPWRVADGKGEVGGGEELRLGCGDDRGKV